MVGFFIWREFQQARDRANRHATRRSATSKNRSTALPKAQTAEQKLKALLKQTRN
jgi:hypothetical protein